MKINARIITLLTFLLPILIIAGAGEPDEKKWILSNPLLYPGEKGSFDEVAVKDPSIVFYEGSWHLFFTARSAKQYTIGHASVDKLTEL